MTDTSGARPEPHREAQVDADAGVVADAQLPGQSDAIDPDLALDAHEPQPSGGYDPRIDLGEYDGQPQGATGLIDPDRVVPAQGGTFGVGADESGYRSAGPTAPMAPTNTYAGGPADYHSFSGQGQGQNQNPEMLPPQYGTVEQAPAPRVDVLALVALALGVLAVVAMLFPGWLWMAGGALGVIAVVLAVLRLRGVGRLYAILGLVTGMVAIAIAVATALVVYVF